MKCHAFVVLVATLAFLVRESEGFRCVVCSEENKERYCTPIDPSECPVGLGKDICNCCDKCLNAEGEPCGGLWNMKGSCGEGLQCILEDGTVYKKSGGHISPEGTCQVSNEDPCLDCRVVKVKCRSPESLGCPDNFEVSSCSCCPVCL